MILGHLAGFIKKGYLYFERYFVIYGPNALSIVKNQENKYVLSKWSNFEGAPFCKRAFFGTNSHSNKIIAHNPTVSLEIFSCNLLPNEAFLRYAPVAYSSGAEI